MNRENSGHENSNVNTENISHSGSEHLPQEMREQPVRPFDKTPLSVAYDSGLVQGELPENATPAPLLPTEVIKTDSKEKSESNPWYKSTMVKIGAPVVAVAASAALAFGLLLPKGDSGDNNNAPAPNPNETSQAEEPATPVENPGTGVENEGVPANADAERIFNDPSRVSAEEIAAMSPQELTDFISIEAEGTTPEDFAKHLVTVYDAWINAGATESEVAPYLNEGKGVYESAMAEKYDGIFKQTISPSASTTSIEEAHENVMNTYSNSQLLEKPGYQLATVYKSTEVVSDSGTTNGFHIIINTESANNPEESGISEIVHKKNSVATGTWDVQVGNIDGRYVVTSFGITD